MVEVLQRRVGGVPVWAWGGAVVLLGGAWVVFKRKKGPQAAKSPGAQGTSASDLAGTLGGNPPGGVIIIPSPTEGNTGLMAPPSDSGASSSVDGNGTGQPAPVSMTPIPAPAPAQPTPAPGAPLRSSTGWWPAYVSASSPNSMLVYDLFMHYLGRPVTSQADMNSFSNMIATRGYGATRQFIANSPEARQFAAQNAVQP